MSDKSFYLDTVRELVKLVKENDLGEITVVADGDKKITIKGKVEIPQRPVMPMPPMPQPAADTAAVQEVSAGETSGNQVKAPIVGTFYSAPSPDAEPFVKVGQTVKKGDTIFIIESMKVMNEVTSEFDGVVKEILVGSGEPVDFDQTVMVIG